MMTAADDGDYQNDIAGGEYADGMLVIGRLTVMTIMMAIMITVTKSC